MSEKSVKKRISVTLTNVYIDGLTYLVGEGLYLNRGEIILDALRGLMRRHGIEPFLLEPMEKPVEKPVEDPVEEPEPV